MSETKAGGSKPKTEPPRSKVVIRRLPPTLPEETFWTSVETWVTENTCLWRRYVRGRAAEGNDGHAVFSRAYVLFSSAEAVSDFHRGYDGHVFRSKAGEEFQAVVELAPVQKTPYKAKVKVDARQGTIDTEPDYLSFLESLKAPPEKPVLEVSGPVAQPTTTPLLEHLRVHGRPGKGSKGKDKQTTSSSDATARRAIASVNAAAAKRAPNANGGGPILIAGRGREVMTAAAAGETTGAETAASEGGKKKRNRAKNKNKDKDTDKEGRKAGTGQDGIVGKAPAPTSAPAKAAKTNNNIDRVQPRSDWAPPEGAAGVLPISASLLPRPEGEAANKGGGGGGGRGGRGGGRGGGGRGGKGGEGKGGEGKEKGARAAVTSILTKNAEGEAKRGGGGGGRGRSKGRGGGTGGAPSTAEPGSGTTPAAASARIDD